MVAINTRVALVAGLNTLRHELTTAMHTPHRSRRHPLFQEGFAACQALVGSSLHRIKPRAPPLVRAPINSFGTVFFANVLPMGCQRVSWHCTGRYTPGIHPLRHLDWGVSNPHSLPIAFVSQCQCRQSAFAVGVLSDLYTFHPHGNSLCPTFLLQLGSFHRLSRVEPWDLTADLAPTDALRPIIPDNAHPSVLPRLLAQKKRSSPGPSTSTRHCSVRLSPIAENSPLLPPVGSLGRVSSPSVADRLSDQLIIALVELLPHQLASD
ncbi:hypothetical protein H6P81_000014 [Aristolochia fimbriata]|uniref:Uncharacterized protein n=1 Tax=Aristolochia fimbriata TaxID=158543 RepID=A0AAV7F6N9_ARIFI|nr:hypothetical protein H6P81_000014 [Aristolochia fimbriata]